MHGVGCSKTTCELYSLVQTPRIPVTRPYNTPLCNPLYHPLEGVETVAHVKTKNTLTSANADLGLPCCSGQHRPQQVLSRSEEDLSIWAF